MDGVGFFEPHFDTTDLAVDVDIDVPVRLVTFVMKKRLTRLHRLFGIEDCRKKFVLDVEQTARRFGGTDGFGDNGGDPLPGKADNIVEDIGIVRIDQVVFVGRCAVEPTRDILPGKDANNSGNGHGPAAVNGADARVRAESATLSDGAPRPLRCRACSGHLQ